MRIRPLLINKEEREHSKEDSLCRAAWVVVRILIQGRADNRRSKARDRSPLKESDRRNFSAESLVPHDEALLFAFQDMAELSRRLSPYVPVWIREQAFRNSNLTGQMTDVLTFFHDCFLFHIGMTRNWGWLFCGVGASAFSGQNG